MMREVKDPFLLIEDDQVDASATVKRFIAGNQCGQSIACCRKRRRGVAILEIRIKKTLYHSVRFKYAEDEWD